MMLVDVWFFVDEYENEISLEFELLNGCGITLSVWKNRDEPSIAIWHDNQCCHFTQCDLKTFSEWLAIATGEKNDVAAPLAGLLELSLEERLRLGIVKRKPDNVVAFKLKDPPDGGA
jgi:hypothetical protein